MNTSSDNDALLLVRDRSPFDRDTRPYHRSPQLVRIRDGAYVEAARWNGLSDFEQHVLRIRAAVATRRQDFVIGFESAGVFWRYPRIGAFPAAVHLIAAAADGVHSGNGIRFHRDVLRSDDVCEMQGLRVTTPARTLVDMARLVPFAQAICALDRCLNRERSGPAAHVQRHQLLDELASCTTKRGSARASRAIAFADGAAFNAGESLSRVLIAEAGFPAPVLQRRHRNPLGGWYFTDFEWPDSKLVGEFDGKGKYLKPEYLDHLSPGEAVFAEKRREDHIRAEGNSFARWTWADLFPPHRLRQILTSAGLQSRRGERDESR